MRQTVLSVALLVGASGPCLAGSHVSTGMRGAFMPLGTFRMSHAGALESDQPAFPAIAFSPFADYFPNRYLGIGFGPEVVLNVIPDVDHYSVGKAVNLLARLRLDIPAHERLLLYGVITPGYSFIVDEVAGNPHGFVVGAQVGGGVRLSRRHAVFVEVGYIAGFQRARSGGRAGSPYAPSYLVTSLGWELRLDLDRSHVGR